MPGITIAGTALELNEGGEGEVIFIGEESRAYAGGLRSSIRSQKRTFTGTTVPTAEATWDTLRAAIANGAQVTASGVVLSGDTITASVKATAKPAPGLSTDFWVISITGQQV